MKPLDLDQVLEELEADRGNAFELVAARFVADGFVDSVDARILVRLGRLPEGRAHAVGALKALVEEAREERRAEMDRLGELAGELGELPRDSEELLELLRNALVHVPAEIAAGWTREEAAQAEVWALDVLHGREPRPVAPQWLACWATR